MTVSMIKDYFEDRRRRKSDQAENTRHTILIGPQEGHNLAATTSTTESQEGGLNVSEIPWHAVKTG